VRKLAATADADRRSGCEGQCGAQSGGSGGAGCKLTPAAIAAAAVEHTDSPLCLCPRLAKPYRSANSGRDLAYAQPLAHVQKVMSLHPDFESFLAHLSACDAACER